MTQKSGLKKRLFLGVDPGMSGAIAVIDWMGDVVKAAPLPILNKSIDVATLATFIRSFKSGEILCAAIEQVHAMPGQGVVSMFTFGRAYGLVEGVIGALFIPYLLVTPQAWTKEMHIGVEGGATAKDKSLVACRRLFPSTNLHEGPRSGKPDSGVVDAILIAEYCRRKYSSL